MQIQLTKEKKVYNFCEPYIIAEIGANHNGDINLAKKMIDVAVECGCDAVKFQSWTPESLIAKEEYDRNQSYDDGDGGKKHFGSLKEMVGKYYLRPEQHHELNEYCKDKGVDFCSSPFSNSEVDLLMELDVPFLKIASMDINNIPFLREIVLTGLVNNIFNVKYVSNGYYYTYDDTFSVPGVTTTVEGTGYYPQATINFLIGAIIKL